MAVLLNIAYSTLMDDALRATYQSDVRHRMLLHPYKSSSSPIHHCTGMQTLCSAS